MANGRSPGSADVSYIVLGMHNYGPCGSDLERQGPPKRSPVDDIEKVFFVCPVSISPGNQVSTLRISVSSESQEADLF